LAAVSSFSIKTRMPGELRSGVSSRRNALTGRAATLQCAHASSMGMASRRFARCNGRGGGA
jgi:hypothetical protein